jgi:beta-mannosidase
MEKQNYEINLNGSWVLEGMEYEEGLDRKAYNPGYIPNNPVKAVVPCIVQSALLEAGVIEDPYYETNNEKILWIEQKEWWFFKEFDVPEDNYEQQYHIVLDGITYKGTAWLNGVYLGHLEGTFKSYTFHVNELIKPGCKNYLAIRLRALENSFEDRPGGKIKNGILRSSGVVAPFSYWWNWAPHIVPIGIWKPVTLKVTGKARMKAPFVTTDICWNSCDEAVSAKVKIQLGVEAYSNKEEKIVLKANVREEASSKVLCSKSEKILLKSDSENINEICLEISKPKLWWPNGMGEHPSYILELTLECPEDGYILDTDSIEFGIRELEMKRNTEDVWVQEVCGHRNRMFSVVGNPYAWTFSINRKKVFVRGTNWVPSDSLFRFTKERYKVLLDQTEAANLNMLRVWGGGVHETKEFYKLCNQKGILVWSEFWLACASYPAMPHQLFIDSAVDMIKDLRNHPSVVMWSGGNEYNPDEPENKALVDKLEEVCKKYDPTREFHRGSPYKGDRHGGLVMLPSRTTNKYRDILEGDSKMTLFRSEVAIARSAPLMESIKKFIGEDKIWPINKETWQYHHANVTEQRRDALEYGATEDLEHWLMAGQIVHGLRHRHNLEYCRQTKYYCSGCMQWQLNVSWPTFHRELIDWYGAPKPAFYAYKRAAQDYIVVGDMEKYVFDANEVFSSDIYAISDRHTRTGKCTVRARIYNFEFDLLKEINSEINLGADESVHALKMEWRVPSDYTRNVFFLHLEMERRGEVLADNLYWMGTSAYCRPQENIDLSGRWKYQVEENVNETRWKLMNMPNYVLGQRTAPPKGKSLYLRKSTIIPQEWQGTELEVYSEGIEGYDEVYFNGIMIGNTECDYSTNTIADDIVYTHGKGNGENESNSGNGLESKPNQNQYSIRCDTDPVTVPNIVKRFYKIPSELIKWGEENNLDIKLYGDLAYGMSEPVFIRKASDYKTQKDIIEYNNEGKYLAKLRNLPCINVEADIYCANTTISTQQNGSIHVILKNTSDKVAFFTGLKLKGLDGAATEIYSDNYFSILPGTMKEVVVKLIDREFFTGEKKVSFELCGWNIESRQIGEDIILNFEA